MREYTFSLAEVAERIERLPVLFVGEDVTVVHVTQNGKPVMEILPPGLLKALHAAIDELSEMVAAFSETPEIVQDEELMAKFRQRVQKIAKGVRWEDVKKEHGWE